MHEKINWHDSSTCNETTSLTERTVSGLRIKCHAFKDGSYESGLNFRADAAAPVNDTVRQVVGVPECVCCCRVAHHRCHFIIRVLNSERAILLNVMNRVYKIRGAPALSLKQSEGSDLLLTSPLLNLLRRRGGEFDGHEKS